MKTQIRGDVVATEVKDIEELEAAMRQVSADSIQSFIHRTFWWLCGFVLLITAIIGMYVINAFKAHSQIDSIVWMAMAGAIFGMMTASIQHWFGSLRSLKVENDATDTVAISTVRQVFEQLGKVSNEYKPKE